MKKGLKVLFTLVFAAVLVFGVSFLTSCNGAKTKIGVLVADATGAEALGFKSYYVDYIEKNYDVQFIYSAELSDAEGEKAAIENFITNNVKAVISLASADRPAQIKQCNDAGIYYAVATGTLSDDEYETYKNYEYYVGAIGPDLDTEFQTGYDMAQYYIDNDYTKFALHGAGVGYRLDMHVMRTAGMIAALCANGMTYKGYGIQAVGDIIGDLYTTGTVDITQFAGDFQVVGYHALWGFGDAAWHADQAAVIAANPEVILCAGSGLDVYGAGVANTNIEIADVDSYTDAYGEAMEAGIVTYLAGKFSSSIGPIFIAVLNAVNGNGIKDGNSALALGQGYWVATSYAKFQEYQAADASTNPAYNKAILDKYLVKDDNAVTFAKFSDFVSKYSFEEIKDLKNS